MSFDWLNVPGLHLEEDSSSFLENTPPIPNVSFQFDDSAKCDTKNQESQKYFLSNELESNNNTLDNKNISTISDSQLNIYRETQDDLNVPLSLSQSQLTSEEFKTYLRWYGYISKRKNVKIITLEDIFIFLNNFPINEILKERVRQIFKACKTALNIGQFFAVLRIISNALTNNILPTRKMVLKQVPILKPKSILSTEIGQEIYEEVTDSKDDDNNKVDFDNFASLLLTGKTINKNIRRRIVKDKNKIKKVRFSENLVMFHEEDVDSSILNSCMVDRDNDDDKPLDLSLPMDQLLKKLAARKNNSGLVSKVPSNDQPNTQEEREILEDMKDSLTHFKQIQNADNASINGIPSQIPPIFLHKLNEHGISSSNSHIIEPLKPTATGSANYLFRSNKFKNTGMSNTIVGNLEPLKPTATGSMNYLMKQQFNSLPPENNTFISPHIFSNDYSTGNTSQEFPKSVSLPYQSQDHKSMDNNVLSPLGSVSGTYFNSLLFQSPSPMSFGTLELTPITQNPALQKGIESMKYTNFIPPNTKFTETNPMAQFSHQPLSQKSSSKEQQYNMDILGDLNSLKQQVEHLNSAYM